MGFCLTEEARLMLRAFMFPPLISTVCPRFILLRPIEIVMESLTGFRGLMLANKVTLFDCCRSRLIA